jgi:hypothetical protein
VIVELVISRARTDVAVYCALVDVTTPLSIILISPEDKANPKFTLVVADPLEIVGSTVKPIVTSEVVEGTLKLTVADPEASVGMGFAVTTMTGSVEVVSVRTSPPVAVTATLYSEVPPEVARTGGEGVELLVVPVEVAPDEGNSRTEGAIGVIVCTALVMIGSFPVR